MLYVDKDEIVTGGLGDPGDVAGARDRTLRPSAASPAFIRSLTGLVSTASPVAGISSPFQ